MPKKSWFIVFSLLFIFLVLDFLIEGGLRGTSGVVAVQIIATTFSTMLLVFAPSALLAAMAALIPFRQKTFTEKFKLGLPLISMIILSCLIFNFGYVLYLERVKGLEIGPLHRYEDIEIPSDLDCGSIKDGTFELKELVIVRKGNHQTQTNRQTKETEEFNVEWIGDCEYILTTINTPHKKAHVKVVSVSSEGYGCHVSPDDRYPSFWFVKRSIQ